MARTINGNLTGMAARLQRIDDMLDFTTPKQDAADAMQALREIDPNYWEAWYDANVVEADSWHGIAVQVWARVHELRELDAMIEAQAADARDYAATIESARF
jgi:hypothetical protein